MLVAQDLSEHLVYALSHGLVKVAQQVIEKASTSLDLDFPLSCANCQGLTPLSIAALLPSTQCLEMLLSKDVAIDVTDGHGTVNIYMHHKLLTTLPVHIGRTALHWSVIGGRVGSVRSLLKYSSVATLNTLDKQGLTPLLYAVLAGSHDIAAAILKVHYRKDISCTYILLSFAPSTGWGLSRSPPVYHQNNSPLSGLLTWSPRHC